jgi:putative membrane protein
MTYRSMALAGAALALVPATASARPSDFPDDHAFIVNAGHANVAEIAAARLALNKSDDADVRAYARKMIADHTKAQAELKRLAKAWDTKVPNTPAPQQKREAAKLKALSGTTFDRTYIRRQVTDHRLALGVMLVEATGGKVSSLRAFANRTAPVVRMHLRMAQAMR